MADSDVYSWRSSASFVTGRNNAKAGYQGQQLVNHFPNSILNDTWTSYTFNNGIPSSLTQTAGPALVNTHVQTHSLRAGPMDAHKLALSGLSADHTSSFFPSSRSVPTVVSCPPCFLLRTARRIDITRLGAVYDVFGNGKRPSR